MCSGNFDKDPIFVAENQDRYRRDKATYWLRGRYRRISGKECVYCGAEKETGDHVPSLFAGYTNGVVAGVIVPVCKECNTALGPFASTCFRERLELLKTIYIQKATRNEAWANDPKSKQTKWRERADLYHSKAETCRVRQSSSDCNMLTWKIGQLANDDRPVLPD